MKKALLTFALVLTSTTASAEVAFVNLPDAGLLKWQYASDGKVYLRNLNEFDAK